MNSHSKTSLARKWEKQSDGSLKSGDFRIQKVRIMGFGPCSGKKMYALSFMGVDQDLYHLQADAKQGAEDHASGVGHFER